MNEARQYIIETPGPIWPRLSRNQIQAAFQSGRLPIIAVIRHCPESECIPVLEFLGDDLADTAAPSCEPVTRITPLLQSNSRGFLFL